MVTIINYYIGSTVVFVAGLAVSFLFLLLSVYLAIRHILFSGKITTNKIVGSLCIYLLIGIIWGIIYIFIAIFSNQPFNGIGQANDIDQIWDYFYFSFVTLTTLGFGDISPTLPIARSLTYLEAICGQFYLAILVSTLVGAYIAESERK